MMQRQHSRESYLLRGTALLTLTFTVAILVIAPIASATSSSTPTPLTLSNLESQIEQSATTRALPTLVVPLASVGTDNAEPLSGPCLVDETATTALGNRSATCDFGDLKAKKTMILFGDSNAWMWLLAFNQIGITDHFKVELDARAGCEVANLPMFDNSTLASAEACTLFRSYVFNRIATVRPFLTVIDDYEYTDHLTYAQKPYTQKAYLAGLTVTVSTIKKDGSKTILLSPPPPQFADPVQCLSINVSNIQKCSVPAICLNGDNYTNVKCQYPSGQGASIANVIGLSTAVKKGNGTYISLEKLFCTSTTCPAVVDHTVVMFDQLHVSGHYSMLAELALAKLIPAADL
jgi:hypothetical protein